MTNDELKLFERLLDSKFQNVNQKVDQILGQVEKTSNHIVIVESRVMEIDHWRSETIGKSKAYMLVGAVLAAILGFLGSLVGRN